MPGRFITIAETPLFVRQAAEIWNDDEREAFIDFIARNPKAGDIIPGTGGVRKVRWTRGRIGKRGGTRVIYFYYDVEHPLYLLMIYAKAGRENLTSDEKRSARNFVTSLKRGRTKT